MISAWLDLPVWQLVLLLALAYAGTALLLWLLLFRLLPRPRVLAWTGLVGPYFTGCSVLFALLTGFTANDTWERNRNAARAVLAEQDALLDVFNLSVAAATEMSAIRAAELAYLDLVLKDEWPRLGDHHQSEAADQALGALLSLVAEPRIGAESGVAVHAQLVEAVLRLRGARYDRLAISTSRSDDAKWISVLALALLTQVALAMSHLEKPHAHLLATLLYAAAVVAALGPIAAREHPFDGRISVAPLAAARALIAR